MDVDHLSCRGARRRPGLLFALALALPAPLVAGAAQPGAPAPAGEGLRDQALQTLKRASAFFRTRIATRGGYVYHYSLDLQRRWGEGEATSTQIWVQPPGTPAVGLAYLKAYDATRDAYYLEAATEAAEALIHGQLVSGGWSNSIDFDPRSPRAHLYRNGKGNPEGRNQSSLDDDQTQSALRFLIRLDRTRDFKDDRVHEAAKVGLEALLQAQFPNGGFPQGWREAVRPQPVIPASYPAYDWRTEGRVKNYWDMYTLNDGLAGTVASTLQEALETYRDDRYRKALMRLGDFLILAQMPDPQPAWAQQYSYAMHPIWARRFEPAAIAGRESEDVIETLMSIYEATGDARYLKPVPRALQYLKQSRLPDGRLARYYELRTNRPLYMTRNGDVYSLAYDDIDLPEHYGWKSRPRLDRLEKRFASLVKGRAASPPRARPNGGVGMEDQVRKVIGALDGEGRWVSRDAGTRLGGEPRFDAGMGVISSELFIENCELLSDYITATSGPK